ncbi:Histone chaperone asf1, partial [Conglomerata obtusa]
MHLHKITPPIKQQFTDPYTFTLTFDNPTLLPTDLEFTITYTGSPDTSRHDQLICTEHIGPVPAGRVAFDLVTDPVRVYDLPLRHLFGVTSVVIIGRFGKCEFLRVGYFVKVQVEGVDDEKLRFEDEEESGDEIDESCDNSEDVDGEEDNEDLVEGEEGDESSEIIKDNDDNDDEEDNEDEEDEEDNKDNEDNEDFEDDIEGKEIIEGEEIIEVEEEIIKCKDNLDGEDGDSKYKKIYNDLNINNVEGDKNVQVNENLLEQFNNQKTLSILKDETLKCVKDGFQESKPKKNKKYNSF